MPGNKVHDGRRNRDLVVIDVEFVEVKHGDPDPEKEEKAPAKKCGSKTRSGGSCGQAAGWGTDHPGSGRCKLHGGASTGPNTDEGKKKVGMNAIRHGGYIERILNDDELQIYDWLTEDTIEKKKLDREDPIHMATLHRACMSFLKMMRLDQYELEEIFEPIDEKYDRNREKWIVNPRNIYDVNGNVIGVKYGNFRRIRWASGAPWETHFQQYMKLLGIDRATEQKTRAGKDAADSLGAAAAAFGWLFGITNEKEEG